MKILIVGGHLSPALALIDALPKDNHILYVGRKYALEGDKAESLEYQKIKALNLPFENLETGRLQRKFTQYTIPSLFKLPIGFLRSVLILLRFRPDVILAFGGYLQIPIALAGYLLRIPIIIHEQTLKAGLANRATAPLARIVCVSFKESMRYFPANKTKLTGLPLRKEFREFTRSGKVLSSAKDPGRDKLIYITGGSLGAHAINSLIEGSISQLLEHFYIIHQTGGSLEYDDFARLSELKDRLPPRLRVRYTLAKYIDPDEVVKIMRQADIIISRSGINTVAEILYSGIPSILIPLPHGQRDEQFENAKYIQKYGRTIVLDQKKLTPKILYSQIIDFAGKLDNINKLKYASKEIQTNSADKIIEVIQKIACKKNQ